MNRICMGVAVAVLFAPACAQDAEPAFAAVSIKPTKSRTFGSLQFEPGGRLTGIGISVYSLVNAAYGCISAWRVRKGPNCPAWIDTERFDIEAVAEEGAISGPLNIAQLREMTRPMIQRLLAERFHVVIQRVPKEMPVYKLTVAKQGTKLAKASISEDQCRTSPDCHKVLGHRMAGLSGTAISIADLVFALEPNAGRPIVDETGVEGLFSMQVRSYASMRPELEDSIADVIAALPEGHRPPSEPIKPSLPSILEKDFGLLLQPGRAQIETIEIESVSRPSPN